MRKSTVSLSLDDALVVRLREIAQEEDRSLSNLVERLLKKAVDEHDGNSPEK